MTSSAGVGRAGPRRESNAPGATLRSVGRAIVVPLHRGHRQHPLHRGHRQHPPTRAPATRRALACSADSQGFARREFLDELHAAEGAPCGRFVFEELLPAAAAAGAVTTTAAEEEVAPAARPRVRKLVLEPMLESEAKDQRAAS